MRLRLSIFLPLLLLLTVAPIRPLSGQGKGGSTGEQSLPSLQSLLDPGLAGRLRSEGRAVRAAQGAEASRPTLLPLHPGSAVLREAIAAEAPSILVEALFLLERPAPADPGSELRAAYGLLRSFASLEGIEYWSASRKTWRTFYAESYRIDGALTRRRLPDEAPPAVLPREEELFALQRDLSFGENVYRYRYKILEGAAGSGAAIFVEQTNLTRMSYGIVPVLGVEGLRTRILVLPTAEGILFYAASASGAPALPGLRGKLEDSFSNRAAALFRWFSAKLPR